MSTLVCVFIYVLLCSGAFCRLGFHPHGQYFCVDKFREDAALARVKPFSVYSCMLHSSIAIFKPVASVGGNTVEVADSQDGLESDVFLLINCL